MVIGMAAPSHRSVCGGEDLESGIKDVFPIGSHISGTVDQNIDSADFFGCRGDIGGPGDVELF
jgi:hypothetical protein